MPSAATAACNPQRMQRMSESPAVRGPRRAPPAAESSFRTFQSNHHPGATPAALVYGRALGVPLSACVIPLMLIALAAVLQEQPAPALGLLVYGLPAALLVATAWTHFHLRRTPAAIRVEHPAPTDRLGRAVVLSVADCLQDRLLPARLVVDLRRTRTTTQVSIGLDTYELPDAEWPEHDALLGALRAARHPGSLPDDS